MLILERKPSSIFIVGVGQYVTSCIYENIPAIGTVKSLFVWVFHIGNESNSLRNWRLQWELEVHCSCICSPLCFVAELICFILAESLTFTALPDITAPLLTRTVSSQECREKQLNVCSSLRLTYRHDRRIDFFTSKNFSNVLFASATELKG